jgi:hypothetical protein
MNVLEQNTPINVRTKQNTPMNVRTKHTSERARTKLANESASAIHAFKRAIELNIVTMVYKARIFFAWITIVPKLISYRV